MLNVAKQLTNGAVPMGGVIVRDEIYQTFMEQGGPDYMLELPHGYTYSGHPVAVLRPWPRWMCSRTIA